MTRARTGITKRTEDTKSTKADVAYAFVSYQGSLTATLGIRDFISRVQPANPRAYQNSLTPEESGSARPDIRGPSARTSN
jgi:hypothetical protein